MRKHCSQMKAEEKAAVEAFVHTLKPEIGGHAADRMREKAITPDQIAIAVKYGECVEIHNEAAAVRVVMRHRFGKPKVTICAVVAPETNTVVTTWKNSATDNHDTLDMSMYDWKADARQVLAL